jgi:hypothetical protein
LYRLRRLVNRDGIGKNTASVAIVRAIAVVARITAIPFRYEPDHFDSRTPDSR